VTVVAIIIIRAHRRQLQQGQSGAGPVGARIIIAKLGHTPPHRNSPPRSCPISSPMLNCSGRKPPFWAVKRLARPYRSFIQTRCAVGNANGA
jgi:hypothetical protein